MEGYGLVLKGNLKARRGAVKDGTGLLGVHFSILLGKRDFLYGTDIRIQIIKHFFSPLYI